MPRGFGRIGIAALLIAALLLGWRWQAERRPRDPVIGMVLDDARLPPLPGHRTSVHPAHIVNLFASWCLPCRVEAPALAALARSGVAIDGIAVRDDPGAVRGFLASSDPFASVSLDPRGTVQSALHVSGLPETYVVDAAGFIVYRHRGPVGPDDVAMLRKRVALSQ